MRLHNTHIDIHEIQMTNKDFKNSNNLPISFQSQYLHKQYENQGFIKYFVHYNF